MDAEFIRDLFAEFGPVQVRRMFGGAGVYADGVMFALAARDVLYLKVSPEETERFAAEGCGPFEYGSKSGKRTITSYWRVPDRLYDETDELAEWARRALAVAKRTPQGPKR
jgi:DNA transformation protein